MDRVSEAWMRGAGPLAVLELLSEREMYGYELAEALDRRSGGALSMAHSTLYPLLYNLEAKGLVRPRTTTTESGRTRKYYAVTADGRAWLERERNGFAVLVEAMRKLTPAS